MEYALTFIEGIASFISPCMLPMLPIYFSYFMGEKESNKSSAIKNSIGFVIGFSSVFILFGIFASSIGMIISKYMIYLKYIFSILIILLGLNYIGILKIKFLNKSNGKQKAIKDLNFIKSIFFGIIFSITWTPCIGTFLSSALMMVAKGQDVIKGVILMILYSMGLGIPFILSVVLIDNLKSAFNFIKKHYNIINMISGIILVIMGVYMCLF